LLEEPVETGNEVHHPPRILLRCGWKHYSPTLCSMQRWVVAFWKFLGQFRKSFNAVKNLTGLDHGFHWGWILQSYTIQ